MDKLREEFEKQIREDLLFDDEELEWQPERNCYAIYGVHLAWWGYRSSRENLVVELPSEEDFVMDEAIDCLNECKSAIRSIGLSIKGE
ncbi:hypothetical protein [Serratia ureilytica]|uniref:hypothetical protein n=1 Tax=Serratia ureilytica TaxID=300181 RepID=UPI00191F8A1F|nr:hypothetical protein [Serratia ureilytica]QQU64017.1 hypothetical protein I6I46_04290 [Serratia ureilytica]